MNEKMDLKGHSPQNTISHCIILNEIHMTPHYFQGRISAVPEIRDDFFLCNTYDWNMFINFIIF